MSDFQSFRNAVLEDEDLQEQVISIVNTATANGAGLGDGIATLAKTHGYTITSDEVYAHADNPDTIVLWEKFATRAHHEAYLAWRIETGMLDMLGPILASGLEVAYLDDRDA